MPRPRLLDLFSCAGGAAAGYHRAGFEVVGVDIIDQPRYPYEFVQGDALEYLAEHGHEFDVIHASPPCQAYTPLRHRTGREYPDLVGPTRDLLNASGRPWVIENVPRSPLIDPIVLCGSMFDIGIVCRDGQWRQLRRHRLFESNVELAAPGPCAHRGQAIGVYGHGAQTHGVNSRGFGANTAEAAELFGIDWMTKKHLSQAIPPAYAHHVGEQLLAFVVGERLAA